MADPRPCRVCRRWFLPDPKVGNRQHVCGDPACQKEWHRKACSKWRRANQERVRSTRFAARLVKDEGSRDPPPAPPVDPMTRINWHLARREVGEKTGTFVAVAMRLILQWLRETSTAQFHANKGIVQKVSPSAPRETSSEQILLDRTVPSKVSPDPGREEKAARPVLP